MGKVLSVAAGKVQRFNVENRAQKVISRDKPTPAPKFEANIKDLERILKGEKSFVKSQSVELLRIKFQTIRRLLSKRVRRMLCLMRG